MILPLQSIVAGFFWESGRRNQQRFGVAASFLATIVPSSFEDFPEGFVYEVVHELGSFEYPTAVGFAPPDRMFVALKSGIVLQFRDGTPDPVVFADLRPDVNDRFDRGKGVRGGLQEGDWTRIRSLVYEGRGE